ncbi:MAG: FAD-dependent oxidoreductase [Spirochaetales bacterium]|nr:FAD-dependent oxidoreductase [Spirochaetales bacterium]
MSDNRKGSILKPFRALRYLAEKPVTIRVPDEFRPTAERYRGFHVNDWDKCIGCGTCAEICDNDAIRMVEIPGLEKEVGKSNLRPAIDYGRCCWCALCVDMCTTNSLTMTQEYTHIDEDTDSFYILPKEEGIHKKEFPAGYVADKEINFLDLERVAMEELTAEERITSFMEIVKGYSREQAIKEASRCVACGLCTDTCPAHMDIPEYIDAIWNDNVEESARQIYRTNPLPEICGRICTHKCETACSIGVRGEPVAIRWLKRYAMDNVPEEDYDKIIGAEIVKKIDKKIAIVGAGPAGLSAAYYLGLMGYRITVYDAYPEPGGMMRYGIPEYRMPYDMLDKDISFIKRIGVKFKQNTRVGKDVSLSELHNKYDIVLVSTGLHLGRSTRVPGTDHKDVFQAIDLLRRITLGEKIQVNEHIVVIGGGNVAMDIARSLARLQKQKYGKVSLTVTSLETRDIMPADEEEILESMDEGIVFFPGRGPKEIVIKNDRITGLDTTKCTRVFDENHMFSPRFDENDKLFLKGDMIVEAIGQAPDMAYLDDFDEKLEHAGRRIKVDEYYRTNLGWLYVAGDIVKGPDVINGIASGHMAAMGIDQYLANKTVRKIKNVEEVLDIALNFENESYKIYNSYKGKFSESVDTIISDLVAKALSHKERIDNFRKNKNVQIFMNNRLSREQREYSFESVIRHAEFKDGKSESEALKFFLERTKRAYSFYMDFEKMVKYKELEFLLHLFEVEEEKCKVRLEAAVAG